MKISVIIFAIIALAVITASCPTQLETIEANEVATTNEEIREDTESFKEGDYAVKDLMKLEVFKAIIQKIIKEDSQVFCAINLTFHGNFNVSMDQMTQNDNVTSSVFESIWKNCQKKYTYSEFFYFLILIILVSIVIILVK
ncbi:hypothetical protein PVAND_006383 [Polypedilum vanderplanki]|uniref:Transmembrane protein n=1 Tax=Polypedilum vanderplanki TaxID=319348 RepID=A0A9J6C3G8_POLVA|nr:hypothetical protein PVAND_006383 [Polypedilum vanderplanki]